MMYKQVKLTEETKVQYVGVYVLKWDFNCGQPAVGFTEIDYTLDDALDDLESVQFIQNSIEDAKLAKSEIIEILKKLTGMENEIRT